MSSPNPFYEGKSLNGEWASNEPRAPLRESDDAELRFYRLLIVAAATAVFLLGLVSLAGCAGQRVGARLPHTASPRAEAPTPEALPAPSNLLASDPCVTRWGRPCATNSNNSYTGKLLLRWDYFENVPGVRFLVWATNSAGLRTNPHRWVLLTNTTDKFFSMPVSMAANMFFAVSASNTVLGTESDFAGGQ